MENFNHFPIYIFHLVLAYFRYFIFSEIFFFYFPRFWFQFFNRLFSYVYLCFYSFLMVAYRWRYLLIFHSLLRVDIFVYCNCISQYPTNISNSRPEGACGLLATSLTFLYTVCYSCHMCLILYMFYTNNTTLKGYEFFFKQSNVF